MGLDIYAIQDMRPLMGIEEWIAENPGEDIYDHLEDGVFYISPGDAIAQDERFPGRLDGIEPDVVYAFDPGEARDLPMGSYSTYHAFRDSLEGFGQDSGLYNGGLELVCDFNDDSGAIGPVASVALFDALSSNAAEYEAYLQLNGYDDEAIEQFGGMYEDLSLAFCLAAETGAVVFC